MSRVSANIPFLKTKVNYAVAGILFSALTLLLYCMISNGFSWIAIVLSIPHPLIAWYIWKTAEQNLDALQRIESVLTLTNQGELYHRITVTRGLGEVGKVAW